jgi:hypothetical protein
MSLGNSNVLYIPVPSDSNNGMNIVQEMAEPQGQFPTYNVSSAQQTHMVQVMEKSLDDSNGKSPAKQPLSKGAQQIYVQKKDGGSENSLIHPRDEGHRPPSRESSSANNRSAPPTEGHVVHHHQGTPVGSNNQSPYMESTSYSQQQHQHQQHREVPRSPSQRHHHDQQGHDSTGRMYHKKSHVVHEMSRQSHQETKKPRAPHLQNADKKVYVYESTRGPIMDLQSEHQHHQQTYHQQGEKKHSSQQQPYHHSEAKSKHGSMRSMQRDGRVMQQHSGEHKGQQQMRETVYHLGEQKSQKIHYQHSADGKQIHLTSRPMYHHPSEQQKSPQLYEGGRQMQQHQQHAESKSQHSHNEHKKHQETSAHHHNEHKPQHEQQQHQPTSQQQHAQDSQKKQPHDSSSRSGSTSGDQKGQQKNVHKYHHGNARVKYVEFKPIQQQEGVKYRQVQQQHQPQQQQQHTYNNSKQMLYYANHTAPPGSHHLTVATPTSQSPMSPLHSPPALRPPPTLPSGAAWHSPPSLVPSPEVRPRFDFNNSPQPATTSGSPHQVQYKTYSGSKSGKQISVPASHNILVPRVPGGYLASPGHQTAHGNIVHAIPRSKSNIQHPTPASIAQGTQPVYDAAQSGIAVSSVATTVTVTMTYIPIPTSTKDKVLYFPVANSGGQPVVLYQNQQGPGKPVILPQQMIHQGRAMPVAKDNSKDPGAYTTVRLQGVVNSAGKTQNSAVVVTSHTSPMKNFKYHFANPSMQAYHGTPHPKKSPGFVKLDQKSNMGMIDLEQEKQILMGGSSRDYKNDGTPKSEMMTMINSQLRLVPPHIGVHAQSAVPGAKRNNMGAYIGAMGMDPMQSPGGAPKKPTHEELMMTIPNNVVKVPQIDKKKLMSRPSKPDKIVRKGGSKKKGKDKGLDSLLTVFSEGKTNANEALIEAYKKHQQVLHQKHYFEEPFQNTADLPPTPETWTVDEVHRYLLLTDCSSYAEAIKTEEIDGKSFLLLTHEALMDFLGVKFGPALKIAGHAASLRARQRTYYAMQQQHMMAAQDEATAPSKEKKTRVMSPSGGKPVEQKPNNEMLGMNSSVTGYNTSNNLNSSNNMTMNIPGNSSSAKDDSLRPVPVQRNHSISAERNHCNSMVDNVNSSMTELIIPNIAHLTSPVVERKERPQLPPPPPVSEHSPVVLKVPNPMNLMLGQQNALHASAKPLDNAALNGVVQENIPSKNKYSEDHILPTMIQNNKSVPASSTTLQGNVYPSMMQQKPSSALPRQENLYLNNMMRNVEYSKPTSATSNFQDNVYPSMVQKPVSTTTVTIPNPQNNSFSANIANIQNDKFEFPSKPLAPAAAAAAANVINIPNVPKDGVFATMMQQQRPPPIASTQNNSYPDTMQDTEGEKLEFPPEPVSMVKPLNNSQDANHLDFTHKPSATLTVPIVPTQQENLYPNATLPQNTVSNMLDFPTKSNLLPSTSMVVVATTTTTATTTTQLNIPTLTEIEPDGSHQNS